MAEKWIQNAIKKKGALRKKLGIKEGETISMDKLHEAMKKGGIMAKEANLAMTLRKINKKK